MQSRCQGNSSRHGRCSGCSQHATQGAIRQCELRTMTEGRRCANCIKPLACLSACHNRHLRGSRGGSQANMARPSTSSMQGLAAEFAVSGISVGFATMATNPLGEARAAQAARPDQGRQAHYLVFAQLRRCYQDALAAAAAEADQQREATWLGEGARCSDASSCYIVGACLPACGRSQVQDCLFATRCAQASCW